MQTRRTLLSVLAAPVLCGTLAVSRADSTALPQGLRGALDARDFSMKPEGRGDQSEAFRALLDEAVRKRLPVTLPPGDYRLTDIDLPDGLALAGTAGTTRLLSSGPGPVLKAEGLTRLTLTGLSVDGMTARSGAPDRGLIDLRGIEHLTLDTCTVAGGTAGHGLYLERCGGRVRDNDLSGAGGVGLFAVDSRGLAITGNTVSGCGNGGILVHRSQDGDDGTIVSGNSVSQISASDGGTGENGNGINIFRAGNVVVSGNHVSDCAFSAIRANAASNVLIAANQCLRSGETAIYSEFGFQGAVITGNVIDTAANGILVVNLDVGGRLATVAQNVVRNITGIGPYPADGAGFGLGISVEADTAVTGNVLDTIAKWGLLIGWGPYLRNVSVTGNIVRDAPLACAVTVVEGAGAALIADNLFQDVETGILGYRWTEKATEDLMDAGASQFPHLTLSGNRRAS